MVDFLLLFECHKGKICHDLLNKEWYIKYYVVLIIKYKQECNTCLLNMYIAYKFLI